MIDSVSENEDLTPGEKETTIRIGKDQSRLRVFSVESSIMKRLLAHPEFEIDEIRQTTTDGWVMVDGDDLEDEFDGRRSTVSVRGTMPVGVLTIKRKSRKSGGHARMISNSASDLRLSQRGQ